MQQVLTIAILLALTLTAPRADIIIGFSRAPVVITPCGASQFTFAVACDAWLVGVFGP